jgi:hypothetical protein
MYNYISAQGQAVVHVVRRYLSTTVARVQSRVTSRGDRSGQPATGADYSASFCGFHPLVITSLLLHTHSLTLPQVCDSSGHVLEASRLPSLHSSLVFLVYWGWVRLSPLGTRALTGLLYQPRWEMMSVELSVGGELAVETEVLRENLPQRHFIHHKSHMTWPRMEPGPPWWEDGD